LDSVLRICVKMNPSYVKYIEYDYVIIIIIIINNILMYFIMTQSCANILKVCNIYTFLNSKYEKY
jgi:hypothetical protein